MRLGKNTGSEGMLQTGYFGAEITLLLGRKSADEILKEPTE
jgi:hypothetical protein